MITVLRTRLASGLAALLPRADADPLLVAASVLLLVTLAGIALAAAATILGLVIHVAAFGVPWRTGPSDPAWLPISGSLFALGALWMMADIAAALLAMIAAVGRGEAFALANVARMEGIAWTVIGLQVLAFIARVAGTPVAGDINGLEVGIDLSPAGIALALMLFILARVFRQGAALRAEVEATV